MGITHSVRKMLSLANDGRLKALIKFLDLDIQAESTFVYMRNSKEKTELVISSGEIKIYNKVSVNENKILTVEFNEPIKAYGKCELSKTFSVDLKSPKDDIILFSSEHSITELFSDFLTMREQDTKKYLLKRENKLIFSHSLCKFLLHRGLRIIDTKPDKQNHDNWIPVFLVEDGFYESIEDFERLEGYRKEEEKNENKN